MNGLWAVKRLASVGHIESMDFIYSQMANKTEWQFQFDEPYN